VATTSRPGQRAADLETLVMTKVRAVLAKVQGTQIVPVIKSKNGLVMTKNLEECGLVQDRLIAGEVRA